jgi:Na+-driven multidrug efflux pump
VCSSDLIYFVACFFIGFNVIISVYLTSTERVLPAHILSFLRGFVIILPLAMLLSTWYGMSGVWLATPLTEFIACLLGVGYVFWRVAKP